MAKLPSKPLNPVHEFFPAKESQSPLNSYALKAPKSKRRGCMFWNCK